MMAELDYVNHTDPNFVMYARRDGARHPLSYACGSSRRAAGRRDGQRNISRKHKTSRKRSRRDSNPKTCAPDGRRLLS